MSEDFIRFENVKKVYHTGEVELTALHEVSFSVARGEICVIVGESGAGKTTLLNILGGMDTLTEGTITVDGEEVSAYDERRLTEYRRCDVGFVFQFSNDSIILLTVCPISVNSEDTDKVVKLSGSEYLGLTLTE